MKKIVYIVLILIGWQCISPFSKTEEDSLYILDANESLKINRNSNDSLEYLGFSTHKTICRYEDTFLIAKN